jgi:hypothetical protein
MASITAAIARLDMRDVLEHTGEMVTLRRGEASVSALARVKGFQPEDLVGSIQQGDRSVILLAEDLENAGWDGAPRQGDRLKAGGAVMVIQSVDGATRRVSGVTIAYEIVARGM